MVVVAPAAARLRVNREDQVVRHVAIRCGAFEQVLNPRGRTVHAERARRSLNENLLHDLVKERWSSNQDSRAVKDDLVA